MYRLARSLLLALVLVGCGKNAGEKWALTSIEGFFPDLKFSLASGPDGRITADAFRGKFVLLFFGYAHCPDVCPITLSKLAGALQDLGPEADDMRIVFVSVDPARDTAEQLQTYAHAFSPEAVGVTGTPEEIEAMAKRYRVAYQADPPGPGGNYEVMHSKAVYIFDRAGHARLMVSDDSSTDAIVHDLRQLLASEK